ncbi:MAG TPA: glycosyltransferase family 39 protein [Pyrinomonadaceae bacterium]|nr:glycosyltransferase family 39 protein [Pyrinomonadaceae bacterium]
MKKKGAQHKEHHAAKGVQHKEPLAKASRAGGSSLAELFDARLVVLMLAVKALVLLFGVQAFAVSSNQSPGGWLAIWNRWDAPHYLDIARMGYVREGVEARWIVFYPLYPWLVRAFAFVTRDELLSAFFVSTVASLAAGLLLHKLAELDEEESVARASVFFLFIFPTSYFLHIGYTESLFIALSVGAFLAARLRRWWLAGTVGALACMTRVNGLALIPALAFEAFEEYRRGGRRLSTEWLWLLLPAAGFGVYLLINLKAQGDALAFLRAQDQFWQKSLTWPWVGIGGAWSSVWARAPSEAQMVGWQEFFFVILGLALTVWAWLRLRASYAVWMTLNWLLWTSTHFVLSVPRYTLVMFPAFILFARASRARPLVGAIITVWSLLFLALFVTRFVQGYWAF